MTYVAHVFDVFSVHLQGNKWSTGSGVSSVSAGEGRTAAVSVLLEINKAAISLFVAAVFKAIAFAVGPDQKKKKKVCCGTVWDDTLIREFPTQKKSKKKWLV